MLPSCIRRSDIVRRFVSALVAVVVLAGCSAARAATLVVNTTADSNDGAGSCSAGTCSLRDAISQAAAGDTITFNSAVEGTITLTSALPVIAQNLTIQGPGVNLLTISGASTYQVFLVQPSSGTISVSISGITIAQGYSAVAAGALAINANATVSIDQVSFSANLAPKGAAILNQGTQLTISNSSFAANSAGTSGQGGAIYNKSPLTVLSSTFAGNAAYQGAVIDNESTTATVINSTFANNTASGTGGIFNNSTGTLSVSDSTFAGNIAPSSGAGIANSGTLTITNTILDSAAECQGSSCPAATDTATGNVVGPTGLKLAPLGYYGGPTQTLLPLYGSNVICAGVAGDVPALANNADQRGFPVNASCVDAGADQTNYLLVNSNADPGAGSCTTTSCSLRDAVTAANSLGKGDIAFASSLNGDTITLAAPLPLITGDISITGPGQTLLTISGANHYQIFELQNPSSLALYGLTLTNASSEYSDSTLGGASGIGYGGAIHNDGGFLTISNCAFSGSVAGNSSNLGEGGAVLNRGTLFVSGSSFSGNSALGNGGGGAITNAYVMSVSSSTFSGNSATGGGAMLNTSPVPATVSYSTFTGNTTTYSFSGALVNNSGSSLNIQNDTFAANIGGGVYNDAAILSATNTIFAESAECRGASCVTTGAGNNYGTGLTLSPLGSYGGSVQTMVPLPGSSAICGGLASLLPAGSTTDERGYPNENTSYTGYSAATPCVDSGAVQTNYTGVQWVQQPSNTEVDQPMAPAPSVEVLETNTLNNSTDAVDGIPLTLTLNGSGNLAGGSATTSGGVATFSALSVDTVGTGDTLATNAITVVSNGAGTTTLPAQTSNSFNITESAALSVAVSAAGVFTQGQTAEWDITVTNTDAVASTIGTTNFADTLPSGYTISGFGSTSGWSCSGAGTQTASCSNAHTIGTGASFPPIQLIVNVPATSPVSVTDTAYAWGGGDAVHNSLATAASGNSTVSVVQIPASIIVNGSATQSAIVGTAFGSLAVTVKDAAGAVIANYSSVTFTAPASGASGSFSNSSTTLSTPTNASGIADPGAFTANHTAGGPYSVTASAAAATTSFSLTNTAAAAAVLQATGGSPQSTYIHTGFSAALSVLVTDAYSNPVPGQTVTFAAPASGASASLSASSCITAADGTCSVTATANGAAGSYNVSASFASVSVNFALTNTPSPSLVVTSPTDDSGSAANCTVQSSNTAGTDTSCSLRDALLQAAALGTANIYFDTAKFASAATITLTNGTLTIPSYTSISGLTSGSGAARANLITISGNNAATVLRVSSGETDAAIANLNLTAGNGANGGAISNSGALSMTGVSVAGSAATGNGGGIWTSGTLALTDTTLSSNSAGAGGALFVSAGTATLTESTVAGNTAITGNGGGIVNQGTLMLQGVTISANSAPAAAGGGIENTSGAITLANTIVAGNSAASFADISMAGGTLKDSGGNQAGNGAGGVSAIAVKLAPLANYGGAVQTMVPIPGSPAICAGVPANLVPGISTDERGLPNENSSYTGYSSGTPCVDAGAVQTSYSLVFSTEPGPISPATAIYPNTNFQAGVTLNENGTPFAGASVTIPLTLNTTGTGTLTNGSAGTSAGIASYSTLQVSAAGSGDTLTATVPLNAAATPAPVITVTSAPPFNVAQNATTTTAANAATTYSPNAQTVSLSASVTSPGGTVNEGSVTFTVLFGGTTIGTPVSANVASGTASVSYTLPAGTSAGTYTIQAAYSDGTGTFGSSGGSASSGTLTISKAATTTTLSLSSSTVNPGASVTLSVTVTSAVSGTPTGTVSFYDGSTLLQTVALSNGSASYSTSALSAGSTHSITAVYSGDVNYAGSSAAASTITVAQLTFSMTASPASQSGKTGGSFTYQLALTPTYGSYPGTVQFSASGLPAGAVAAFSPSSVAANAGQQTVNMTISTSAMAENLPPASGGRLIPTVLALLLLPLSGARKMRTQARRIRGLLCLVVLALSGLAASMALTGCGAQIQSSTYTITVTASSGGQQKSATVDLTLQ